VSAILFATLRPRAPTRAGIAVGLAIAVKLYPVLLVPALLRRETGRRGAARLFVAAALVVAAGYLPHVIAVGGHVLGYLPGYLREENYDSGVRFLLLGLLGLGDTATKALAVAVVAAAVVAVAARSARGRSSPAGGALAILATVFLVVTPSQPWYALLLVCVSILTGRLEWIAVATAAYPLYVVALIHENSLLAGRISYSAAGALALTVTVIRSLSSRGSKINVPLSDIRSAACSESLDAGHDRPSEGGHVSSTPHRGVFDAQVGSSYRTSSHGGDLGR
jgi:hypothetical protein